ncbi:hypothetical protein F2P79_024939 [Pimephales promelas]|nr:hypothetical protein F2P79_024939 [Pimephales promelas]
METHTSGNVNLVRRRSLDDLRPNFSTVKCPPDGSQKTKYQPLKSLDSGSPDSISTHDVKG